MNIGIDARNYDFSSDISALYARELVPRILNLPEAQADHFSVYLPSIVELPKTTHPNTVFVRSQIKPYSLTEQTVFKTTLERQNFDVTHFMSINHPITYHGRTVFTVQDARSASKYAGSHLMTNLVRGLMTRHAFSSASHIITSSNTQKREIKKRYPQYAQKMTTIYSSVDQRFNICDNRRLLDQAKSRYGINKPFVICATLLRNESNVMRLVSAFASVYARGRTLQLVLTGQADRQFLSLLQREITKLHLQSNVILTGPLSAVDLALLYSSALVCAQPSLTNEYDQSVLEAMACGCAIVCSRTKWLFEIVDDAALYFDPFDPADMATKLYTVLRNQDLRGILIKAGNDRIRQLNWHHAAEETLKLYHDVILSQLSNEII